jgi:hypothetical protein
LISALKSAFKTLRTFLPFPVSHYEWKREENHLVAEYYPEDSLAARPFALNNLKGQREHKEYLTQQGRIYLMS